MTWELALRVELELAADQRDQKTIFFFFFHLLKYQLSSKGTQKVAYIRRTKP